MGTFGDGTWRYWYDSGETVSDYRCRQNADERILIAQKQGATCRLYAEPHRQRGRKSSENRMRGAEAGMLSTARIEAIANTAKPVTAYWTFQSLPGPCFRYRTLPTVRVGGYSG